MKLCIHVFNAYCRHLRGGWYVWRDTPDDILTEIVELNSGILNEEDELFFSEAKAELNLRLNRIKNEQV